MRQPWKRPLKTLHVGIISTFPERYSACPCLLSRDHSICAVYQFSVASEWLRVMLSRLSWLCKVCGVAKVILNKLCWLGKHSYATHVGRVGWHGPRWCAWQKKFRPLELVHYPRGSMLRARCRGEPFTFSKATASGKENECPVRTHPTIYPPPPLRKHQESQESDGQTGSWCLDKAVLARDAQYQKNTCPKNLPIPHP